MNRILKKGLMFAFSVFPGNESLKKWVFQN